MEQKKFISFQDYLQEILLQRCQKNASYSLRAFARDIGIHAAALSKILSGRQKMTTTIYKKISRELKISQEQAAWFESELLKPKSKREVFVIE